MTKAELIKALQDEYQELNIYGGLIIFPYGMSEDIQIKILKRIIKSQKKYNKS